ncbi:MAG: hypothetical protein WBY44_04745 [Bryobacteraceae bacterium]
MRKLLASLAILGGLALTTISPAMAHSRYYHHHHYYRHHHRGHVTVIYHR